MEQHPLISLVIPCRNEAGFIGTCIESVIANGLPEGQLEIIVVDGASEDGTPEIVRDYARRYPFIRLLENPKRITPAAMNIGIAQCRGEIIARLDAHSTCEPGYLKKCLAALRETGADNVGGLWAIRPRRDTWIGKAIALCLSHPFGAGNAHYRTGAAGRRSVDTVPFGFYRRDVFQRIGLFNEHLVRGQDMEINLRLKRAGGEIQLDPDIVTYYYARSDLKAFMKHNFADGFWVTYALRYAKLPVSWRHMVPLCFVLGLLGPLVLSLALPAFAWLSGATAVLYLVACTYFSAKLAMAARKPEYLVSMPIAFATRHIAYGIGSLWGVVKLAVGAMTRRATAQTAAPATPQG